MSTALSDSDNADQVDPGGLPSGMRSFLGHILLLKPVGSGTNSMKDRFQTLVASQAN